MQDNRKNREQLPEELADLRRQLAALQASEDERDRNRATLLAAIESLPFDFFVLAPSGHYILQSAMSRANWGDAVGRRPEEVCQDPDTLTRWLEYNRRAFAGQRVEGEETLLVRGEQRVVQNILVPIWNHGQVQTILGMNVDVTEYRQAEQALKKAHEELEQRVQQRTAELAAINQQLHREIEERRRAEEALRQSHEELQAIYRGVVDGLLVADIETKRFLRTNASMCRMLGYTEEELRELSVKDIHPPEDVDFELQAFEAGSEGRLSSIQTQPVLRKDGSVFYADLRSSRIIYDGRPCLLGFFRDISERIEAERALRQEQQILRNLLAAGDRDRQLISYEIHDGLTQQLTGVIMQLQAFESLQAEKPAEAAGAYARGVSLLRASLAEARRMISGVRPPLLDDAGVVAAVENLVMETNRQAEREVVFHSDLGGRRLQPVLENSVYRIIQECLTNACRHSKSDRVEIELVTLDGSIQILVRDWGVGFTPTRVGEGCFGLEGIQERARLLGGQASIDSQLDHGTRICVRLPLMLRELENGGDLP